MKKIMILFMIAAGILQAQTYTVEKLKGTAKAETGLNENWINLKEGTMIGANSIVAAGDNSIVQLISGNIKFVLRGPAAITLSDIKKMSVDDLLLALAMEDMLNAPKTKDELKSKNTAVYGSEENGRNLPPNTSSDFGIKRLNGAMQIAENGYPGAAIIAAKTTFRKYPDTKNLPAYRIYFARLLYQLNLCEEAYDEYGSIKELNLTPSQEKEVDSKIDVLSKKMVKK
jgi:hypothetical protein